ncbi:MAG: hypothetical protein K940chlam8_00479 [Chlamydiae bacterium]|nr:hypothetical protein [Chlamydiota bacterium]
MTTSTHLESVQSIADFKDFVQDMTFEEGLLGHYFKKEDGQTYDMYKITRKFEELLYETKTKKYVDTTLTDTKMLDECVIPRLKKLRTKDFQHLTSIVAHIKELIEQDHVQLGADEQKMLHSVDEMVRFLEYQSTSIQTFFENTQLPEELLTLEKTMFCTQDFVYFSDDTKEQIRQLSEVLFHKIAYLDEENSIQFRQGSIDSTFETFKDNSAVLFLLTFTLFNAELILADTGNIKMPFIKALLVLKNHPWVLDPALKEAFFQNTIVPFSYLTKVEYDRKKEIAKFYLPVDELFGDLNMASLDQNSSTKLWLEEAFVLTLKTFQNQFALFNYRMECVLENITPLKMENFKFVLDALDKIHVKVFLDCKLSHDDQVFAVKASFNPRDDAAPLFEQFSAQFYPKTAVSNEEETPSNETTVEEITPPEETAEETTAKEITPAEETAESDKN